MSRKDLRSGWSQGFPNAIRRPVDRGLSAGRVQKTDTVANEPVMNRGSWESLLQRDPWLKRKLSLRNFLDHRARAPKQRVLYFSVTKPTVRASDDTQALRTSTKVMAPVHRFVKSLFVTHWRTSHWSYILAVEKYRAPLS